jgi:hypothetical protein
MKGNMIKRSVIYTVLTGLFFLSSILFISCGDTETIIKNVVSNEVSANQRLQSAIDQAHNSYGDSTNLVLVFGKNVKPNGKTELSAVTAVTNPDSIGAWLYLFKSPADTTLRIYTPNPLPGADNCIEITAFFDINSLVGLIRDTSAQNIVAGALSVIINSNVSITTSLSVLADSPVSLDYANNTNPVIKFDENFVPDTSSLNGSVFFSTGVNQTRNMFLIPAAGTLNLPSFITELTGFPADLWIVNYKKTNSFSETENLILGTVVEGSQVMGIPSLGLSSKVINISKYVSE